MKYVKQALLGILIIGSIYMILSCIVSIPLMDENNYKVKDLSNKLSDELKSIRATFNKHLDEFSYDSLTLSRYDETSRFINIGASSFRLKNYLTQRINSYKRSIENAEDLFIYKFNIENNDYDFKSINEKKNKIIQYFKKNCDNAEREVTNNFMSVIKNINTLHSISLVDTSLNYRITKEEFKKINDFLFFSPIEVDYGKNLENEISKKKSSVLFFLSEKLLEKNSSSLVVILGMLGVSFMGAIVNLLRKNTGTPFTIEMITDKLFSILLISVASSLITYLSLQGGISIATVGSDAKLNPYLILFVCFTASVYSEDIWLKIKTWLGKSSSGNNNSTS
jgi:hypothetical protein